MGKRKWSLEGPKKSPDLGGINDPGFLSILLWCYDYLRKPGVLSRNKVNQSNKKNITTYFVEHTVRYIISP